MMVGVTFFALGVVSEDEVDGLLVLVFEDVDELGFEGAGHRTGILIFIFNFLIYC